MLVAGPMTPGGEMRRFLISVFFLLLAVPAHAADGDEGMPWFKESFLDIREVVEAEGQPPADAGFHQTAAPTAPS
jgi:hypothetical protein